MISYHGKVHFQSVSDVVEEELRSMHKLRQRDLEHLRMEADKREAEALVHQKITRVNAGRLS